MNNKESIKPADCPLCGNKNNCGSILPDSNGEACWCMDESVLFPKSLLEKVPSLKKGKACICQSCLESHKPNSEGSAWYEA